MTSKRTFYRTIIQVEVLSETPYNETSLAQIAEDITEGNQVGKVSITTENEELDAKTTVKSLQNFEVKPSFFLLDKNGQDIQDEEEESEEEQEYSHKVRKMKE